MKGGSAKRRHQRSRDEVFANDPDARPKHMTRKKGAAQRAPKRVRKIVLPVIERR